MVGLTAFMLTFCFTENIEKKFCFWKVMVKYEISNSLNFQIISIHIYVNKDGFAALSEALLPPSALQIQQLSCRY